MTMGVLRSPASSPVLGRRLAGGRAMRRDWFHHRGRCASVRSLVLFIVVLSAAPGASFAQSPVLVGMGDSIGEGVQSAEGSRRGQKGSYLVWIARQMGAEMPLPLIDVSPFSTVESTRGRRRVDATVEGLNLSVSGARVRGLLRSQANAPTAEDIDSETDLVLFPRQGSPMEVVESMSPAFVVCWIGRQRRSLDRHQLRPARRHPDDVRR